MSLRRTASPAESTTTSTTTSSSSSADGSYVSDLPHRIREMLTFPVDSPVLGRSRYKRMADNKSKQMRMMQSTSERERREAKEYMDKYGKDLDPSKNSVLKQLLDARAKNPKMALKLGEKALLDAYDSKLKK